MRRTIRREVLVFLTLVVAAACGSSTPTTPTTTPTPATTTDTFKGTLTTNGALLFPVTVAAAGTVTATLTSVAPDDTIAVGFNLGTWNGTVCAIVLASPTAKKGAVLTGTSSTAGSLCALLHDPNGVLTAPVDVEISVVHP